MSYFSIIIPVYNRAGLMDACVASVTSQTFTDFEVILIDDGSTDATPAMLLGYTEADRRFRIITHPENRSVLVARYTGMKHATGKYVLFLDSDDELVPDALSVLYESLEQSPVDILRFGHEEVYHNTEGTRKTIPEQNRVIMPPVTDCPLFEMLSDRMAPNVWKNCYAISVVKKALRRTVPFYCNMGEDVYWSTVLFSCAKSDATCPACLYHYHIGGGMSTAKSNHTVKQLLGYMNHIESCMDHVKKYLSRYAPEFLSLTEDKFLRMNCFLMLTFVIDEADETAAEEYVKAFDTDVLRPLYLHGMNTVLPFKRYRQNIPGEKTGGHAASDLPNVHYLEDLMCFEKKN